MKQRTRESLRLKTSHPGRILTILRDYLRLDMQDDYYVEIEGISWVNISWANMPDITDELVKELKKQEKGTKFYWKIIEDEERI